MYCLCPAAVMQMKKMLSANAEAPYNIECLMEDVDVKVWCPQRQLTACLCCCPWWSLRGAGLPP